MSYLNWKTWALTALLAPTATFAQVCTPLTPDSSCVVIKNADTGAEIVTAYDSQSCITPDGNKNCIRFPEKNSILFDKTNFPNRISVAYNRISPLKSNENLSAHISCFNNTTTNSWNQPFNSSFSVFDISNCDGITAYVIIDDFSISGNDVSHMIYDKSVGVGLNKLINSTVTPNPTAPVPAPAPALTYLTFDGYCDEIQFQQIPGSSTFYGTNSPNSCEAGALMFGYVLTGSDNKIHVTLSGGYADAAGNVNALKAVDLELVKADQTDISGNFSAFGIARDAGNRSATQITGQLNGTWKLDTTSRGSKTFATRSAVKPQKSIFSGM